ncbi:hypothetical protein J2T57_003369 [Natronocella acetinitrilica]|uniref:Uncharacterized protein n=1 Tax=Natronocella acetinitrilica TaxID=414046 RepID=A0AAE3G5D7_9GAMM|nr:hypothetical protein [Natronocella acetinitrilica]MCP1676210.1 hypothetical protein [Natronocella acetinitrilica]
MTRATCIRWEDEFHDPLAKVSALDAGRVDVAVRSPAPPLFYYWAERALARDVARMVNDGVAEYASTNPERFRSMATLGTSAPRSSSRLQGEVLGCSRDWGKSKTSPLYGRNHWLSIHARSRKRFF